MGIFDPQGLPSSPTSQSSTTSGIASWAQPYVMNYLNQGNNLLNAAPTAMQNQAWDQISSAQTPGQFAQGSNYLNQAGQGMLGTTGQALSYGAQGAGYGQQATGAGQAYQQMATDPSQIAAYMNPFVQQALAPQLQLLNQQQALQGQGIASKAAGQGAFGGNRATLAQGLNAQNYALAGQQAIGQGYTDAFKQAQQAQQFGADLGLRGLQTGIQGAQTGLQGVQGAQQGYAGATQAGVGLGNIGAQQSQSDLARTGLLNTMANQQYNLPFQRLNFMQGLMSGLPVSTSTTQGYLAGPNKLSQLTGAVGALGSYAPGAINYAKDLYNRWNPSSGYTTQVDSPEVAQMAQDYYGSDSAYDPNAGWSAAQGGQVKRYAEGGITSINRRVMNDPTAYSEQTINRSAQDNVLGGVTKLLALDTIAKQRAAMQNQQAMMQQPSPSVMAQLQQQAMQAQQMAPGIDSAESNLPQQYAGGGIIAFEEGGSVINDLKDYYEKMKSRLSRASESTATAPGMPSLFGIPLFGAADKEAVAKAQAPAPTDAKPDELGRYKAGTEDSGIVIHPNAPAAPTRPSAPQAYQAPAPKDYGTDGIGELVKGYESMIKGGEDFKKAESDADRSAFRKTMLGMMAGKSPYFFTNLGEAGEKAQEGLDKTLEGIQARKDAQLGKLVSLGLKGQDLKNEAIKLGISEAELEAKLPLYQAQANYYNAAKGKGTGSAGLGSIGAATTDKVLERFDAYRADYKNPSNPYVAMLSPQDQLYLQKGSGKSLSTARQKLDALIDIEQQKRLNTLAGYSAKRPVSQD